MMPNAPASVQPLDAPQRPVSSDRAASADLPAPASRTPVPTPAATPRATTALGGAASAAPVPARVPFDQLTRRILGHLAARADIDAAAVAVAVGVDEPVARARLAAMAAAGLLGGVDVRLPVGAQSCEFLVRGVPTGGTDRQAIGRLCAAADVQRVFGLASAQSLAFLLQSPDADKGRERALELARAAGLHHAEATLIVSSFKDPRRAAADALAAELPPPGRQTPGDRIPTARAE